LISPTHIQASCKVINPKWLQRYKPRKSKQLGHPIVVDEPQSLTQQEQHYVKAHEDEYRRNHLVDELLELWTGKTKQQRDEIMLSTPKGIPFQTPRNKVLKLKL
jgi:hypothetical protein